MESISPVESPKSQDQVTWRSEDLLQGTKDVVILHQGEQYHLKLTKHDKLILMK